LQILNDTTVENVLCTEHVIIALTNFNTIRSMWKYMQIVHTTFFRRTNRPHKTSFILVLQ